MSEYALSADPAAIRMDVLTGIYGYSFNNTSFRPVHQNVTEINSLIGVLDRFANQLEADDPMSIERDNRKYFDSFTHQEVRVVSQSTASGTTDVGLHSGGAPRDTAWPLVLCAVRHLLDGDLLERDLLVKDLLIEKIILFFDLYCLDNVIYKYPTITLANCDVIFRILEEAFTKRR